MRVPLRLLAVAAAAAAPLLGMVAPQVAATPAAASEATVDSVRLNGFEAKLVEQINAARRAHGLRQLVVTAGTTDVARAWAWHLAHAQALSHNPSLVHDIAHHGSGSWTQISENVGEGPSDSPTTLFQAYMASPPHRANILDGGSRYIGVGVVERGSTSWNTLDFTNSYNTGYGRTRVPPAAMSMDRQQITATTDVAGVERPDQRFGTTRHGSVAISQPRFSGPSAANDRVSAQLSRHGSLGHGQLLMRAPLLLTQAHTLQLQLVSRDPRHRPLTVTVRLAHSFASTATLGTVHVRSRRTWYSLTLPASARSYRDTLLLRVGSHALGRVGGRARLAVLDVRAGV
jgi:uncharacterized protein YkwD